MDIQAVITFRVYNSFHLMFMQGTWETAEEAQAFINRNGLTGEYWLVYPVFEIKNPQWRD